MKIVNENEGNFKYFISPDRLYHEMHDRVMKCFKILAENMKAIRMEDSSKGFSICLGMKDIIPQDLYETISSRSYTFNNAYGKLYAWLHEKYGLEIEERRNGADGNPGDIESIRIEVNKEILERIISEDYVDTDSVWDSMGTDIIIAALKSLREVYKRIPKHTSTKEFGFCFPLETLIAKSGYEKSIPSLIRKNDRKFMRKILEELNSWIIKNNLHSNLDDLLCDLQTESIHTMMMKTICVSSSISNQFITGKINSEFNTKDTKDIGEPSLASELRHISEISKRKRKDLSKKWLVLHTIFDHLPDLLRESAKSGESQLRISLDELVQSCGLDTNYYSIDEKLERFLTGAIRNWCNQKGIQFYYTMKINVYTGKTSIQITFNWE